MGNLLSPEVIMLMVAGSLAGYLFGILPGLDGLIALALFAPVGLYLKSDVAFYFYAAILGAVTFAGSVPAILFNIPGTPFSVVTTFDGFEMSRQGRAMEALAISAVASALGGFVSVAFLILSLPVATEIVMLFGPAEKFWLVLWAFLAVPFLAGKDWLKGLVSVAVGLVLSFIGRSVVTGEFRYTFGTSHLASGLGIIPFLAIGVFAVRVILEMLCTPHKPIAVSQVRLDMHQIRKGVAYVFKHPVQLIRGSFIGTLIGAIPGLGPVTASFLAYLAARGSAKTPGIFGKGTPAGILAPESANNAVQGGAGITTLLLGVPGSLDWAILLGIMVMYGITPGPDLISEHPQLVLGIIAGIVVGNALASSIGLLAGTQLARLTGIRPLYITPLIFVTCMLGAYMINNVVWDCMIALVGGLFGYFIHKLGYELLALTMGFILGPYIEVNFYQTLQVGLGTTSVLFGSVMSVVLVVLCVATIAVGPWLRRRVMREEADLSDRKQPSVGFLSSLFFPLIILALAVYAFTVSFGYQFETRIFTHSTATILIVLSVALLIRETTRGTAKVAAGSKSPPAPVDRRIPPLIIALSWCVGFFVAVLLIGFVWTVPIWLFMLLLSTRASKIATVLIPILLWAVVEFGLEYSLETVLFKGILLGDRLPRFW